MTRALIYLLAISAAEVTAVFQPLLGIAGHTAILVAAIVDSARIERHFQGRLILSLALIPLVRIISLTLPLAGVPRIWWYPIIYLPLLAAAVVLARLLDYRPREIGIATGFLPVQLVVASAGVALGIVEYLILSPVLASEPPLVADPTWQTVWLPALVLMFSTGFVEEFIFRGVLQRSAVNAFGGWGIVYIAFLFAALHIGWVRTESPLTWLDLPLVFGIALFFGWVAKKTGSLFGVSLSHGITNIVLFIVAPFFF
jgi:membrane protease YdiL (CAAX protease family)